MAFITGTAATRFGRMEGRDTLALMTDAAAGALRDGGFDRSDIDGLICGYSTVMPHLMLSTLFAEHFGLQPSYAHGVQVGGATGMAMIMLAALIVDSGTVRNVLVVAGENRLMGQSRDTTIQTLAQAGQAEYEVPLGPTVPAYYGLLASRYMHDTGLDAEDLAEVAVLMRRNAASHPGAHLRAPLSAAEAAASRPIAEPLRLVDCCPISDGGAACVVSAEPLGPASLRVRGAAQAHLHQHVTVARDLTRFGSSESSGKALDQAGVGLGDIRFAAIYDSFTITLAMLLEEIGFSGRGRTGADIREGRYERDGPVALNTHGGLLSYGHCGVGGAMAHLAETHLQMTGRADARQVPGDRSLALLHGDGGIMSSHVSLVLETV